MIPLDTIIEAGRCELTCVEKDDNYPIFKAAHTAGFTDGMQWVPPEKAEDLIEMYESTIMRWENGVSYTFSIRRKADRDFVGRIGLRLEESGKWDAGFFIVPWHQRQGYATEALKAIIGFGFEVLELDEIYAGHAVWNEASKKVLLRCGMVYLENNPEGGMRAGVPFETVEYVVRRNS